MKLNCSPQELFLMEVSENVLYFNNECTKFDMLTLLHNQDLKNTLFDLEVKVMQNKEGGQRFIQLEQQHHSCVFVIN